jgi:hypothetical protein
MTLVEQRVAKGAYDFRNGSVATFPTDVGHVAFAPKSDRACYLRNGRKVPRRDVPSEIVFTSFLMEFSILP